MLTCIVAGLRAQTCKYLSRVASKSQVLGHVQVGVTETLASSLLALHVCGLWDSWQHTARSSMPVFSVKRNRWYKSV